MIPSISTTTLGGSLDEKLAAASAAGFEGLELFEAETHEGAISAAALRAQVDAHPLRLVDWFPLRDYEGMPDALHREAGERAAAFLDTAVALGAPMIMMCSNTHSDCLDDTARIVSDLRALGEMASARGLRVAYEALSWGRHVHDYRRAWELVREADHPAIGLVLDSFHVCARDLPLEPIRQIPGDRIFLVQLSDAPMLDLDYIRWSRGHRVLPGDGDFDLETFCALTRETGYDGVVSLECFSKTLREQAPEHVAHEGMADLTRLWAGGSMPL
ncbi:MAG: sugar phosphate isomerase/epimerase [Burkholderiaceae bacterium]